MCETPGIWGALPKGYDHLWTGVLEAYMHHNVTDTAAFTFKKGNIATFHTVFFKCLCPILLIRKSYHHYDTQRLL